MSECACDEGDVAPWPCRWDGDAEAALDGEAAWEGSCNNEPEPPGAWPCCSLERRLDEAEELEKLRLDTEAGDWGRPLPLGTAAATGGADADATAGGDGDMTADADADAGRELTLRPDPGGAGCAVGADCRSGGAEPGAAEAGDPEPDAEPTVAACSCGGGMVSTGCECLCP